MNLSNYIVKISILKKYLYINIRTSNHMKNNSDFLIVYFTKPLSQDKNA